MKQHFLPALRLTLVCIIVFAGLYTLLIWTIAQAAPNHGNGETVSLNNKVVGYKLEGQSFTGDKYFNSRPSACDYNAAASGASNKGTSNAVYLKEVQNRIDTLLAHNPSVKKEEIPSELITSSGSGLDPDLSPQGAFIQVARIATLRGLPETEIKKLVDENIEQPLAGLFGTSKINVLNLNIALDKLKK